MTMKPLSPKKGKVRLASKHVSELAENDYVERDRGHEYSDSDLLRPQGVTVRNSDNESREEGALRTMAQAEEEERRSERRP